MTLIFHERYIDHELEPGHPESPERLISIREHLQRHGLFTDVVAPGRMEQAYLELIHTRPYIEKVRNNYNTYLDADTYAIEVMRTEHATLSLNRKLANALDDMATKVFRGSFVTDPLFVLPIDDFDLNPSSCLKLLRMLRMVSVPRLFTLVLGDFEIVRTVMNLRFSEEFARVDKQIKSGCTPACSHANILPVLPNPVATSSTIK